LRVKEWETLALEVKVTQRVYVLASWS
jgi:hypothetical protein